MPICEKNVPFEATCSFLLLASNPGKPHPIKLQEQHKPFFKEAACIDEFAGEQLAKWAMGGSKQPDQAPPVETDSLEQPSPLRIVPSTATGDTAEPPFIHPATNMPPIASVLRDVDNAPDDAAKIRIINEALAMPYPQSDKAMLIKKVKGAKK